MHINILLQYPDTILAASGVGTYVILAVLVVLILGAFLSSRRHFKGKGGCCGGGEDVEDNVEEKTLAGEKLAEKWITVEGMTCDKCKMRIERRINKIDGAVCHVNLLQKLAVVELDREVSDELLINSIQALDYKVTDIRTK